MDIPATQERVERHTAPPVNRRLQREMEERLCATLEGGPPAMARRLHELDREWDLERTLQGNMALVLLTTTGLGFLAHRGWFAASALVAGFFLQHAVQGWCPPLVPWREAGVRSAREIHQERLALRLALQHAAPSDALEDASERVAGTETPEEARRAAAMHRGARAEEELA